MVNMSNKYLKMIDTALTIEQKLDSADFDISSIVEQPDRLRYDIVLLKELATRIRQGSAKILESVTSDSWDRI